MVVTRWSIVCKNKKKSFASFIDDDDVFNLIRYMRAPNAPSCNCEFSRAGIFFGPKALHNARIHAVRCTQNGDRKKKRAYTISSRFCCCCCCPAMPCCMVHNTAINRGLELDFVHSAICAQHWHDPETGYSRAFCIEEVIQSFFLISFARKEVSYPFRPFQMLSFMRK